MLLPSICAHDAFAIRLYTPGVTLPSGWVMSSNWVYGRISSCPTRASGDTIRSTAAAPDMCVFIT